MTRSIGAPKVRFYETGVPLPAPLTVDRTAIPENVKEELRPLMRPDPFGFLFQWLLTWASIVIAIMFAVTVDNLWLSAIVILFVGTRQNVLALLMHEQTHRLGFRSKPGDYFCQLFVAYPLLVTLEGYRRVHLSHHSFYFTENDPDFIRKQGKEWTFPQQMRYFILILLRDLSGLSAITTFRGKALKEVSAKINVRFAPPRWLQPLFLVLAAAVITATDAWAIIALYWFLPLLTVLQGIIRLGAITEHKYNLTNPAVEESTPLIELFWWEKLLLPNLNFTLHLYHHWFPAIPASRLPQAHAICRKAGIVNEDNVFQGYMRYIYTLLRTDSGMPAAIRPSSDELTI